MSTQKSYSEERTTNTSLSNEAASLVAIGLGAIIPIKNINAEINAPMSQVCGSDGSFGPGVGACRGGFDFTLTFEESVLGLLPQTILLLLAPVRLLTLRRRQVRIAKNTHLGFLKLVPTLEYSLKIVQLTFLGCKHAIRHFEHAVVRTLGTVGHVQNEYLHCFSMFGVSFFLVHRGPFAAGALQSRKTQPSAPILPAFAVHLRRRPTEDTVSHAVRSSPGQLCVTTHCPDRDVAASGIIEQDRSPCL